MKSTMSVEERLAFYKKKQEQLARQLKRAENAKAYLAEKDRAQRTHRLITRGAAIESVFPFLKPLSERQFFELMSWLKDDDFVRDKITELTELVQKETNKEGGDN